MTLPRNQPMSFPGYLIDDDTRWLQKHYPDTVPERPDPGKYTPPRDAYTITLAEAGRIIGITRAGTYKMAVERGVFETCRKVGPPDKPVYILDVREVRQYAEDRHG